MLAHAEEAFVIPERVGLAFRVFRYHDVEGLTNVRRWRTVTVIFHVCTLP